MTEINVLDPYRVLQAVIELQEPKHYVQSRGTTKQQLEVATTVTIIQDRRSFTATSLIDCGCTGSCIDRGFVTAKCIPTDKLPRPIPIYNADGSFNSAGSISDTVTLEITIGEHKEKRTFGVTNLGKSEIFLGHKWLQYHNPDIDWWRGRIAFNDCPTNDFFKRMATLPHGHCTRIQNLDRSPEPPIFQETADAQSTTSKLAHKTITVPLHPSSYPWQAEHESRRLVEMTRL